MENNGYATAEQIKAACRMGVYLPFMKLKVLIRRMNVYQVFNEFGWLPMISGERSVQEKDEEKARDFQKRIICLGTVQPVFVVGNPKNENEVSVDDLGVDFSVLYNAVYNFSLGLVEVAPKSFPDGGTAAPSERHAVGGTTGAEVSETPV